LSAAPDRLSARLLLAMAPLARMAGVVAIGALVVWRWRSMRAEPLRQRISAAAADAATAIPALLWLLYRKTLPVTQSYVGLLEPGNVLEAFGGPKALFLDRPLHMIDALGTYLEPRGGGLAMAVAAALTLIMVVGLIVRLRRNHLDAWVLLLYLGLVWVWPFPRETARLLSCALPLVLVCASDGLEFLLGVLRRRYSGATVTAPPGAVIFALALVAMASAQATIVSRIVRPTEPGSCRTSTRPTT
jgi:hypothetical protein